MFVIVFKCFSAPFASALDGCFKCFICLLLYVASVLSEFFKVDHVVAYRIHVGSGRRASSPRTWSGSEGHVQGDAGPLLERSLIRCAGNVRR